MLTASRKLFLGFLVYWALVLAWPDALLRTTAPFTGKITDILSLLIRFFITNRIAAPALGFLVLLAVPAWLAPRVRRPVPGFPFSFAARLLGRFWDLLSFCYGLTFILLAPFLDTAFNLGAAALLAAALLAERTMCRSISRFKQSVPLSIVLTAGAGYVAASIALGAALHRANLVFPGFLLAILLFYDHVIIPKSTFSLLPETRDPRPETQSFQSARRAFFILAATSVLSVYQYLTAPPVWCRNWKPPRNTHWIIRKTDAFDIITTRRYLFASFKDGTLARIEKNSHWPPTASRMEQQNFGRPLQRMVYSPKNDRLYVTAYKSETPIHIMDASRFREIGVVRLADCSATAVALDATGKRLYFNCEAEGLVVFADAAGGRILRVRRFPRPTNIYALAAGNGNVYALASSLDPYLYELDGQTLKTRRRFLVGFNNQGIALSPGRRTVYVARVFGARVISVNLDTGSRRGRFPAGLTVRDIQPIDACQLFAADYAGADARLIHVCSTIRGSRPPSHRWRLCPRMRGVWRDPATGKFYAAGSCGVMELLR